MVVETAQDDLLLVDLVVAVVILQQDQVDALRDIDAFGRELEDDAIEAGFTQTRCSEGGQHDALVVHWPDGIEGKGEVRNQYHHIIDIAPTILEAAGVEAPEVMDGVDQMPFDGVPMNYTFNNPNAEDRRTVQYYELFGNRAIYQDGWKAVTIHGNRMPWELNKTNPFDADVWELYNLKEDFSQSNNVADQYPEKLADLQALFEEEAERNDVYPLDGDVGPRLAAMQARMDDASVVEHEQIALA